MSADYPGFDIESAAGLMLSKALILDHSGGSAAAPFDNVDAALTDRVGQEWVGAGSNASVKSRR